MRAPAFSTWFGSPAAQLRKLELAPDAHAPTFGPGPQFRYGSAARKPMW